MTLRAEVRSTAGGTADLVLVPDGNLLTGARELATALGSDLTTLERDFLTVAAAVYACDLALPRLPREHVCRSFEVTIPVVNAPIFEMLRAPLRYALYLLSRDTWLLNFRPADGAPEAHRQWPQPDGTTLLFSGGLDSLAAAVDLLAAGGPTSLVSHYTANPTTVHSQESLLAYLGTAFGVVDSIRIRVGGRSRPGLPFPAEDREPSQRTRSFLFVALASIVARRTGRRDVLMMAENGPIAIHLALSTARIGPFSTHTAHPEYLNLMATTTSTLLGVPIAIRNPFVYQTKAEVIARLVAEHPDTLPLAVSCWRASRQAADHCGVCIPCLVRRFALLTRGFADDSYERDLLTADLDSLDPDDDGLRNITDLLEFCSAWGSNAPLASVAEGFLELKNVAIDERRAMEMYRRFGREVLAVAAGFPSLAVRLAT